MVWWWRWGSFCVSPRAENLQQWNRRGRLCREVNLAQGFYVTHNRFMKCNAIPLVVHAVTTSWWRCKYGRVQQPCECYRGDPVGRLSIEKTITGMFEMPKKLSESFRTRSKDSLEIIPSTIQDLLNLRHNEALINSPLLKDASGPLKQVEVEVGSRTESFT